MKILGRRREVTDLQVVVCAELQKAFEVGVRVFRPLSFKAVRQQHYQTARAEPLRLTAADILIDDDLRAVNKVSELGFPDNQTGRAGKRIAVFKAEYGKLRKRAVVYAERRVSSGKLRERNV
jgi:hypothetical protein